MPVLAISGSHDLAGVPAPGKTTMAHHLAAAYGLHVYSRDVVIAAHGEEPGPDTPLLRRLPVTNW